MGTVTRPPASAGPARSDGFLHAVDQRLGRAAPSALRQQSLLERLDHHRVLHWDPVLAHEGRDERPVARVVEAIANPAEASLAIASKADEAAWMGRLAGGGVLQVKADVGVHATAMRTMGTETPASAAGEVADVQDRPRVLPVHFVGCPLQQRHELLGAVAVPGRADVDGRPGLQGCGVPEPTAVAASDGSALARHPYLRPHLRGVCRWGLDGAWRIHLGLSQGGQERAQGGGRRNSGGGVNHSMKQLSSPSGHSPSALFHLRDRGIEEVSERLDEWGDCGP